MSSIDPSPLVGQSSPASAPGRSRKLKHDPALLREEAIRAARYVPPGHPGVWSPGPASGPIRDGEDLRSLPPVSNTGGKSLGPITEPPSLGALFLLPRRDPAHDRKDKGGAVLVERWRVWSVTRRVMVDVDFPVGGAIIDTFTFTFPEAALKRVLPGAVSDLDVCFSLHRLLHPLLGLSIGPEIPRKNFYAKSAQLQWCGAHDTVNAGFVAAGGNADTVCVHITGEGCAKLERKHWAALYVLLVDLGARVSRADLAFDDMEGMASVDWVAVAWLVGAFTNGGRKPKRKPVNFSPFGDDVDPQDGEGRTFYVGSRESDLLFRAYEKGKEQGDPLSPWVRHEAEWKGKDRVIPLDVVLRPHEYLAGLYPALAWISSARCVVPVLRQKVKIAYAALVESCRVSYGRLLWAMADIEGSVDAAFRRLVEGVDDVPKRLVIPL